MWPVFFRIGTFEITSFGVFVALGILVGLWSLRHELQASRLPVQAADAALYATVAGLAGAKLLWVAEHLGEDTVLGLVFSRGGLSWFGGLVAGVGVGLALLRRRGWPLVPVLAAATPGLALGHALGRVGCLLVGDDYGRPTALPWGVAFPKGLPPTDVPVHPTQVYEAVPLVILAAILVRWRRGGVPDGQVLARYLMAAGALRFAIEFIRVNERVALGLSVAHWASLGLVVAGAALAFAPARGDGAISRGV